MGVGGQLMGWLNTTEDSMIALGIDDTTATVPAESGALEPLIDEYVRRMAGTMKVCLPSHPHFLPLLSFGSSIFCPGSYLYFHLTPLPITPLYIPPRNPFDIDEILNTRVLK